MQYIWESGEFPIELVTGVATACFKSGDTQLWKRYRIIVVFNAEFKIFAIMYSIRVVSECKDFISDWQNAYRRGRGTSDEHYIAYQLFRAVCARGERAAAVHVDYSEAFDSLSHIYLFNSLKKAGASAKTLQLFKSIYQTARVVAKVGASLSKALGVGRGVLEGDINSPMFSSVGLEEVFREADAVTSQLGLSGGIKLRDTPYDKIGFADDVTATGTVVAHLSHRM